MRFPRRSAKKQPLDTSTPGALVRSLRGHTGAQDSVSRKKVKFDLLVLPVLLILGLATVMGKLTDSVNEHNYAQLPHHQQATRQAQAVDYQVKVGLEVTPLPAAAGFAATPVPLPTATPLVVDGSLPGVVPTGDAISPTGGGVTPVAVTGLASEEAETAAATPSPLAFPTPVLLGQAGYQCRRLYPQVGDGRKLGVLWSCDPTGTAGPAGSP